MSHELRTPMNHIIGFTQILLGMERETLSETQREYLDDILDSSNHLLLLINEILDLSKIESGKTELQLAEVDLRMLVDESINMVREKAREKNIEINITDSSASVDIVADHLKIKQVFVNLLSNAVKFTYDGGEISIDIKQNRSTSGEDQLEISFSDTGMGLSEENLGRIFEVFEQVAAPLSGKQPGTGLGLALARKLAEIHGGALTAKSGGIDKGATFTVVLPTSRPARTVSSAD